MFLISSRYVSSLLCLAICLSISTSSQSFNPPKITCRDDTLFADSLILIETHKESMRRRKFHFLSPSEECYLYSLYICFYYFVLGRALFLLTRVALLSLGLFLSKLRVEAFLFWYSNRSSPSCMSFHSHETSFDVSDPSPLHSLRHSLSASVCFLGLDVFNELLRRNLAVITPLTNEIYRRR